MPKKTVYSHCRACALSCPAYIEVEDDRIVSMQGVPASEGGTDQVCARCAAMVQLTYSPTRVRYPLKRAGKRGEGKWERISWDQAVGELAEKVVEMTRKYGAETFVFPGRTGRQDMGWVANKIARTIGTPNNYYGVTQLCLLPQIHHQCNFGTIMMTAFTSTPETKLHIASGAEMGYSLPILSGTQVQAEESGFPRIVLDPVCGPFAARSNEWLPIRPGTDLAYYSCVIRHFIETETYDRAFVQEWSNASFLVREDTGALLLESDIKSNGSTRRYMVYDNREQKLKFWDAEEVQWEGGVSGKAHYDACVERFNKNEGSTEYSPAVLPDSFDPALFGEYEVPIGIHRQKITCKPAFQLLREITAEWTFEKTAEVTGIPAEQIERTCDMITAAKPLDMGCDSNYMSTNASQYFLSVAVVRILSGSVDASANTSFLQFYPVTPVPFPGEWDIGYGDGLSLQQKRKRLGYYTHRIHCGYSWEEWTTWHPVRPENADATLNVPDCNTVLTAIETGRPYPVHGMFSISSNWLMHDPTTARWLKVLEDESKIELHVVTDFVMTPTAELADYVFPAQTWMERTYLDFSTLMAPAGKTVYKKAVDPICEARHDYDFGALLAHKLEAIDPRYNNDRLLNPDNTLFWAGKKGKLWENDTIDEERARWCREFTDMTWEEALEKRVLEYPSGPIPRALFRYKIAGKFPTDTGKANLFSTLHQRAGYPPLPTYTEPAESPFSRPDLAQEYPLVLTTGKRQMGWHHSEFRQIPWLRECQPTPEVFINPETAREYGVTHGDWVWVESPPTGGRAPLNKVMGRVSFRLMARPGLVSYSQHGWWRPEKAADDDCHGALEWNCEALLEMENRTPETGTMGLRSQLCKVYKCSEEDIRTYHPMITRDELEALMPLEREAMN
jgi:anaerobic selenocysteine-containing dehydrogenase